MGRVYQGEHTGIGRAVAIKVLHAKLGAQQGGRRSGSSARRSHRAGSITRTSSASATSACSRTARCTSSWRRSKASRSARASSARSGSRGSRRSRSCAACSPACATRTTSGVVHRDIKPDNIFLAHKDGERVIKILDFGIAKLYAGNADDPASTRAGLTVGTPAYLSPEQAVGGAITPASDLYSTSVVLYEMLAGRAPFEDRIRSRC